MVEQCPQYADDSINGVYIHAIIISQNPCYDDDSMKGVYIYRNYNITKIPANAFIGAAYLEVSWYPIQNYIMYTLFIKMMW